MSSSKDPNHSDKDAFVETFKAIPPIPKQKNQPTLLTSADKRKKQSEAVDAAYSIALAAEKPKKQSVPSPTVALMQAMSFNSKDLAINREGEISEGQKKRLTQWFWVNMVVLGGGFAAFVAFADYLVIAQSQGLNIIIVFLSVLLFGTLSLSWSSIQSHYKNLATGYVVPFTGRVRKIGSEKQYTLMVIDYRDQTERIFVVGGSAYNAFVDGATYTLYCPSFNQTTFLSAEYTPDYQ